MTLRAGFQEIFFQKHSSRSIVGAFEAIAWEMTMVWHKIETHKDEKIFFSLYIIRTPGGE